MFGAERDGFSDGIVLGPAVQTFVPFTPRQNASIDVSRHDRSEIQQLGLHGQALSLFCGPRILKHREVPSPSRINVVMAAPMIV
ncbi:MAG TPA: hypothetical protein PKD12_03875 [Nitrospira sp.]|nr:hypothetical protein [Nitrospira sp.]